MDSITSTEDLQTEVKSNKENILLEVIKQVCSDPKSKLSQKLVGKVNFIIAECDLTHYSSLHKLSTADDSTSTVLGFMRQSTLELTFDEQVELNNAIIQRIQAILPAFNSQLDNLKHSISNGKKAHKDLMKELQESVDNKLNILKEQESERVELMMEWLNHRLQDVSKYGSDSTDLLSLKTRMLKLKSKILNLQILQNIFTETNQSIKAYSEIHKDLKDSIRETEERIKSYKEIIESDDN